MADLTTYQLSAITTNTAGTVTYDTFSLPSSRWAAYASDEWYHHHIEAALAGSVLGLTHFASVDHLIICNLDGSNFVTVEWDDAAAHTNTIVVAAGKVAIIPDVDPSATVTVTADTAVVLCDIFVAGS